MKNAKTSIKVDSRYNNFLTDEIAEAQHKKLILRLKTLERHFNFQEKKKFVADLKLLNPNVTHYDYLSQEFRVPSWSDYESTLNYVQKYLQQYIRDGKYNTERFDELVFLVNYFQDISGYFNSPMEFDEESEELFIITQDKDLIIVGNESEEMVIDSRREDDVSFIESLFDINDFFNKIDHTHKIKIKLIASPPKHKDFSTTLSNEQITDKIFGFIRTELAPIPLRFSREKFSKLLVERKRNEDKFKKTLAKEFYKYIDEQIIVGNDKTHKVFHFIGRLFVYFGFLEYEDDFNNEKFRSIKKKEKALKEGYYSYEEYLRNNIKNWTEEVSET
jgi:hypothetical protein